MMKILLLNPHLYEAPILTTLQKLGVAVIVCSDFKECEIVHKFHATSVTLFVGHDEDGAKMNELLKTTPRFSRTPVILTTSRWTEQECIDHQSTPFAANAYLRMPVDDRDFIHVIDEILGTELSHGKGFNISDDLSSVALAPVALAPVALEPAPQVSQGGIQIEEASSVYGVETPGIEVASDLFPGSGISLDAPDFEMGESPKGSESLFPTTSETKEFRPAEVEEGLSPLVTPIEAVSTDAPAEILDAVPEFLQDLSIQPPDEQATRMAIMPTFETISEDEQETRVAAIPGFTSTPATEELDSDALEAMPYLGRNTETPTANYINPLGYREPMDDAVVPGGAATAPDVETLKKYLYLREQDVTALSAQLRQAREQIGNLEGQLKHEKVISCEFAHLAQEQDRRINGFDKEKFVALESAQKEVDDLKFEMKRRSEKIRVMELQVKEATEATERLKERVRVDIRKIRTREKELENRLEIMKKDSEALLGSREQKIIELKRKLDLIEFNTDLLQDQLEKERRSSGLLREKLAKAAQIVRVAGGLLSPEEEALLSNGETSEANRTSAA